VSYPPNVETHPWERVDEWTEIAFDMAGGIYPLEDLSAVVARRGGRDPGVDVQAQPGGDRREVFDRIREAAE